MIDRLYALLLQLFPASFGRDGAAIAGIAREYLADRYRRGGPFGAARAWMHLCGDAVAAAVAEWQAEFARRAHRTPRYVAYLLLAACAVDVVANFTFGNDLSGTLAWLGSIFAIALVVGASLPSRAFGFVLLLVAADTIAGCFSVYATHHNFDELFSDTLRWVPISFAVFALGSSCGRLLRRTALRIVYGAEPGTAR